MAKGNRNSEEKTKTYRHWLEERLRAAKHRKAFTNAIEDDTHRHFMRATQHAAAYAHGPPALGFEEDGRVTVVITGGGVNLKKS